MKVEIWSDIVCPWCYVGKRRFETALEQFDEDVEVTWRSFELDPGAPKNVDTPLDEALANKYGMSLPRARQMMEQMEQTAADEGLEFDFESAQSGNTFDAHRLLHFAKAKGEGDAIKERLLRAYFTEGRSIVDHDALVELAADVGLDPDEARSALEGGAFSDAVRDDEAEARRLGVGGVPFFLVDGKYGVSGAQLPDAMLQVLRRARDEAHDASQTGAAASCDDDGCEVPDASTA